MRKIKKVLCILLALLMLLGVSACKTKEKLVEIVLADFENWAPDFQLLRVPSNFGRVTRNDDPAYVKSGSYSAKIEALGGFSTKTEPTVMIPTNSGKFQFDYTDFRWYKSVKLSIYSEKAGAVVRVGLNAGDGIDIYGGDLVMKTAYTLEQGWNDITYEVVPSLIELTKRTRYINGVSLCFDNAKSRDFEDAGVFYVDDVLLLKRSEPAEAEDLFAKNPLSPYEICDFEKFYQPYLIRTSAEPQPDISVTGAVEGVNGTIRPTSGNLMLRMLLKAGQTDGYDGRLNYIIFPSKLMELAFKDLTYEDVQIGYLRFNIYSNGASATTFYTHFYKKSGGLGPGFDKATISGQWITYSIALKDLMAGGIFVRTYNEETKQYVFTIDMGELQILYREFAGTDREFYFDNFRLEV